MRKECLCLSEKEYKRVTIINMTIEGFYFNKQNAKFLSLSIRQIKISLISDNKEKI